MVIEKLFPTTLGVIRNLFDTDTNTQWGEHLNSLSETMPNACPSEWCGKTYTSFGRYNVNKDVVFEPLVKEVSKHVHAYAELHNSFESYEIMDAFFNINKAGTFQEFHTHTLSIVSAVYYVKAPENSGQLIFQSPKPVDMLPFKRIENHNDLTYERYYVTPEEGMLILFRSNVAHCVNAGTNKTPRISIAFNFK